VGAGGRLAPPFDARPVFGGGGSLVLRRGITGHCKLYQRLHVDHRRPISARRVVRRRFKVPGPPMAAYIYWRNPENLAQAAEGLTIQNLSATVSHWRIGNGLEWDAEVIEDHPDEIIAWRSLPGTVVENAGSVRFESAGHDGTLVDIKFAYRLRPLPLHLAAGGAFEQPVSHRVDSALDHLRVLLAPPAVAVAG